MEAQAAYGVSYVATPATAQPAAGKPLELLRAQVRAFAPNAVLQAYELLEEDGFHPAVYTYHVKLSGSEVRNAVKSKGADLTELLVAVRKAWAKERRDTEVTRLIEECRRLAGSSLEEDFEQALRYEMQFCAASTFNTLAAKWRRKSVAYGNQKAA
jgi:isopentenyl diphosphate isomerase/L-lactate dehydrogenase-like FMN-dependent dehydrogenase